MIFLPSEIGDGGLSENAGRGVIVKNGPIPQNELLARLPILALRKNIS